LVKRPAHLQGRVHCRCPEGHSGDLCESYPDPCSQLPCHNGGECSSDTATLTLDHHDITHLHESSSVKVRRHGTQLEISPTQNYTCTCPREWTGLQCEQLRDDCSASSGELCKHGDCVNVYGGHMCRCNRGWRGAGCDLDIDECVEDPPCENRGTCVNTVGSYRCKCPKFYEGERCETAGVCATEPCMNGGDCVQLSLHNHTCTCPEGYKGRMCKSGRSLFGNF
jgi:Notch-like protein